MALAIWRSESTEARAGLIKPHLALRRLCRLATLVRLLRDRRDDLLRLTKFESTASIARPNEYDSSQNEEKESSSE